MADVTEEKVTEIILGGEDEELEAGGKKPGEGELEHEPDKDHPRFKQIYGKMKQLERDLDTVTTTLKERDSAIDEMRSHNKRLAESIEKGIAAVSTRQEKDTTDDEVAKLNDEIKELKEQKKVAIKDEDFELLDSLNEKIYDKKGEIKDLSSKKLAEAAKPRGYGETVLSDDDAKVIKAFIGDTPWYNEDPIMRVAAVAVDGMLSQDPVWGSKPLKERLIETRKRVEKRFGAESKSPGGGPDGGGNRGGGGPRIVKLTNDQIIVAKGLGLSNEEYAKQLEVMDKGGK